MEIIVSIVIAIIVAIINYMMRDKSTPEKKKAALNSSLVMGAAAGTLAYASGASDSIVSAFDSPDAKGVLTGEPITVQTQADGTVRTFYENGYSDTDPTTGTIKPFHSDGSAIIAAAALSPTGVSSGQASTGSILGVPASTLLPLATGAVAGAALSSTIPSWVWLAGAALLVFTVID